MERERLFRSRQNRIIAGVAGGIADYFHIDPVLIRVLFAVAFFAGGGGVLVYLVLWIAVPEKPWTPGNQQAQPTNDPSQPEFSFTSTESSSNGNKSGAMIAGAILIVAGSFLLFQNLFDWFRFRDLWPLVLILVGGIFILNSFQSSKQKNS